MGPGGWVGAYGLVASGVRIAMRRGLSLCLNVSYDL